MTLCNICLKGNLVKQSYFFKIKKLISHKKEEENVFCFLFHFWGSNSVLQYLCMKVNAQPPNYYIPNPKLTLLSNTYVCRRSVSKVTVMFYNLRLRQAHVILAIRLCHSASLNQHNNGRIP